MYLLASFSFQILLFVIASLFLNKCKIILLTDFSGMGAHNLIVVVQAAVNVFVLTNKIE